jgi:hypothetical protein
MSTYMKEQGMKARRVIYENCVIQSPSGTPVCRCKRERLEWYVSRGLAVYIDKDTIRLHKEPSGTSCVKEATEVKVNICVVCGDTKKLSIHHTIPYCFRNALPVEWRAGPALWHDTVALCDMCHRLYEKHGNQLKAKLAEKFNVSLHGYGTTIDGYRTKIRAYARLILGINTGKKKKRKYFNPPPDKKLQLLNHITEHIGHEPTEEELMEITKWSAVIKSEDFIPYGKYVVDRIDHAELVLMWRKHFLDTMKPRFMPPYWKPDRLPTPEEIELVVRERKDDPKELLWRFRSNSA